MQSLAHRIATQTVEIMNNKIILGVLCLFPWGVHAAEMPATMASSPPIFLWTATGLFLLAFVVGMLEEWTHLRASKPMVLGASLLWVMIGYFYSDTGQAEEAGAAFRRCLETYGELFLFIMVSMSYLNALEQRGVFESLKGWLLKNGYGFRQLFWITGFLAFMLSAFWTNLTTALVMGAVVKSVGRGNRRFIGLACINIVVATNAGGSFSPFGDITTLLVWQKGVLPFHDFYLLFIPALINFLVPASFMHFFLPKDKAVPIGNPQPLKRGAIGIMVLFVMTILTAVYLDIYLDMPPAAGMIAGLTYLEFYFFYLYKTETSKKASHKKVRVPDFSFEDNPEAYKAYFDVFHSVQRLEWDTLLYLYGAILGIGGLAFIGQMSLASHAVYSVGNLTESNIWLGLLSAIVDNGALMYAIITMNPEMSEGQWLLITLLSGVGGSLLAIGSEAGIGLVGLNRGIYTFSVHFRWLPVLLLGFFASAGVHLWLNAHLF
jgi:Na+/H+ antiporter NhaD/arsenite permease-like protein